MTGEEYEAWKWHNRFHDAPWGRCPNARCGEAWDRARELELPRLAARYITTLTR